jgi:hypothetical protein
LSWEVRDGDEIVITVQKPRDQSIGLEWAKPSSTRGKQPLRITRIVDGGYFDKHPQKLSVGDEIVRVRRKDPGEKEDALVATEMDELLCWVGHLELHVKHTDGGEKATGTTSCCYSIGYGAMMVPCCLNTTEGVEESACETGKRTGGATGWVEGACPTSAEEAAGLLNLEARCSKSDEDCTQTKCCADGKNTCYEKNEYWAGCRPSCEPGIHEHDPPKHQTPWSCKVLSEGGPAPAEVPTPAPTSTATPAPTSKSTPSPPSHDGLDCTWLHNCQIGDASVWKADKKDCCCKSSPQKGCDDVEPKEPAAADGAVVFTPVQGVYTKLTSLASKHGYDLLVASEANFKPSDDILIIGNDDAEENVVEALGGQMKKETSMRVRNPLRHTYAAHSTAVVLLQASMQLGTVEMAIETTSGYDVDDDKFEEQVARGVREVFGYTAVVLIRRPAAHGRRLQEGVNGSLEGERTLRTQIPTKEYVSYDMITSCESTCPKTMPPNQGATNDDFTRKLIALHDHMYMNIPQMVHSGDNLDVLVASLCVGLRCKPGNHGPFKIPWTYWVFMIGAPSCIVACAVSVACIDIPWVDKRKVDPEAAPLAPGIQDPAPADDGVWLAPAEGPPAREVSVSGAINWLSGLSAGEALPPGQAW